MSDPSSSTGSIGLSDQPDERSPLAPERYRLSDFEENPSSTPPSSDEVLGDVELDLRIELGRTRMRLEDVLQLRVGSVITLDNAANEPVDVYVNNRIIARGEIVVMDDRFCVRITQMVGS